MPIARVPCVTHESMTPGDQQVSDEIKHGRGEMAGNFRAILNSPQAAGKTADLGAYVRFETPLDRRLKTLAFLTTATNQVRLWLFVLANPPASL